jgi:hypothetical protein
VTDDCFRDVAAIEQSFVEKGNGQGFHVAAHARHEGQPAAQKFFRHFFAYIVLVTEQFADEVFRKFQHGRRIADVAGRQFERDDLALVIKTRCSLKPKNQPMLVFPRAASPAKTLCLAMRRLWQTGNGVLSI